MALSGAAQDVQALVVASQSAGQVVLFSRLPGRCLRRQEPANELLSSVRWDGAVVTGDLPLSADHPDGHPVVLHEGRPPVRRYVQLSGQLRHLRKAAFLEVKQKPGGGRSFGNCRGYYPGRRFDMVPRSFLDFLFPSVPG